jgi:hypothetical protein
LERELLDFERTMGVLLPDAYRRYLREVGAGELNAQQGISLLEEWCQPSSPDELPADFLSQPFPFRESWNDLALLDLKAGWDAPYFDEMLFRGSMRIKNRGCEDYHLLVVSGDERGHIWCDERAGSKKGIYPLQRDGRRRVTVDEYLSSLS